VSRHPVLTWTLRALRAAQLAMLLLFTAYFVSVQINATAYLAGRNRPVVRGTVPPVALGSIAAAVADITAGLIFEAVAALILFIATALLRAAIQDRKNAITRVKT
jgi:hypothetical protein